MNTGFTFNGIHSRTMNIKGIRAPRNILPQRKTEIVSIPQRSLPYVITDDSFATEYLAVECFLSVEDKTPFQIGRDWSSWLKTTDFVDMVFDDDPTFTYKAICTSSVTLQDLRNPIVTINFILSREDTP